MNQDNYDLAYTASLTDKGSTHDRLEALWDWFNNNHPADFQRLSPSVGDIIALKQRVYIREYVDGTNVIIDFDARSASKTNGHIIMEIVVKERPTPCILLLPTKDSRGSNCDGKAFQQALNPRNTKAIVGVLICIALIATAAGTSCTANNLQHYAQETVAADFLPLVTEINNKITDGGQINTELLYAAYITLFDSNQYPDKADIRQKLVPCFYTVISKKVENKAANGNPLLDSKGKPTYLTVQECHAISDSEEIFTRSKRPSASQSTTKSAST